MKKTLGQSRAEKRALWEVRQRYNLNRKPSAARRTPRTPPPPPAPPPRALPTPQGKRPRRGRFIKRFLLLTLLLLLLGGGVFGYKILAAGNKISTTDRSILGQLADLLFSQGKQLQGEADGRINIMLLAIGGEGHQGQNLADTVMVASIRPADKQVALLSIPRDLYVQVPDQEYFSKINAVHAYGESKKAGDGPRILSQSVSEITGLPIHYYGRIDFRGFVQIVDAVGGINITIDNSFFDYWHKISFSSGTEKMDGERALAYVRARYIEGPEGGDFKRAARQQQVLVALRAKSFSVNTALDFTALSNILDSVSQNIRTDLQLWEMKRLYEIVRQVNHNQIKSAVLTTGPTGVLVGTTEILGGTPAAVLKPRTGDYAEIQALAADIFVSEQAHQVEHEPSPVEAPPPSPTPDKPAPKPTIEIRNGTNITGLAKKMSDELAADGYTVVAIGNAASRDVSETYAYTLADKFSDGAKVLAKKIGAAADSGLPSEEPSSKADVLIILGRDRQ